MKARAYGCLWVTICVAALLSLQASAVELEPTEPGTDARERFVPTPPPVLDNPLTRAVGAIEVGEPIRHKGLSIFPLLQSRVTDDRDYLTLDEALRKGLLVVKEVGRGSVPRVSVRNNAAGYVFLLGNELLVGGMQNRMLKEDVLLRPHSGDIVVEVFCIERGRWHNPDMGFRESERMVQQEMRRRVVEGAQQREVWDEVESFSRSYGVTSGTGDLAELQKDRKVARELAQYERAIIPKLPGEAVGLVATRGPFILGADIFANEDLFRKLRRKVIQSYALTRAPGPHIKVMVDRRQVEGFLRRCYRTVYTEQPAPDVGRRVRLRGGGISGMGLSFRDNLVHVVLFPARRLRPLPRIEPRRPPERPLLPRRPPQDP